MSTQTKKRTMSASPEQIWRLLAEFDTISQWAPNVDHSSLLSEDSTGLGATRRIQSGRLTVVEKVTKWEPEAALGYTIEGLPPIVSFVSNEWHLEPDGGGTLVTLTTEIKPGPRPAHKLLAKVLGLKLGAVSKQMLKGLSEATS